MNYLDILLISIFLVILLLVDDYLQKKKHKKLLSHLTGKYKHSKTPNGNILKVEHKDKIFRIATDEDIEILKKVKLLK